MNIINKILITGSSGYIGKHLVDFLSKKKNKIYLLDKKKQFSKKNKYTVLNINLKDYQQTYKKIKKISPNIIIHLASTKKSKKNNVYEPKETEDFIIAKNLIDSCQSLDMLKKFIFLGSCEEYGNLNVRYRENLSENPKSLYGKTKLEITRYLLTKKHINNFPCIIIRPSVVYGPNQGKEMFIGEMSAKLLSGKEFKIHSAKNKRDFIFINDLVNAIYRVINTKSDIRGEIINICSGKSYQLISIAKMFIKILDINSNKLIISKTSLQNNFDQRNYAVSNIKAFKLLNWKPKTSIKLGLTSIR